MSPECALCESRRVQFYGFAGWLCAGHAEAGCEAYELALGLSEASETEAKLSAAERGGA